MAFKEFLKEKADNGAFRQNMAKFGQNRDTFLEILARDGVESTHSLGEVIFGEAKGRRVTTVKLVAVGDWAENDIQVEIFARVAKTKLQQAKKKPTVNVMLTFTDRVVKCSIPNDVTDTFTYTEDKFSNRTVRDQTFSYETSAEVIERLQAQNLIVV